MPWRDATGAIVGVFGISKDVTALKEIEAKLAHERDQLRALLDSSPDTIYFKDLESRFVLVSRSKVQKTFEQVPDLRKRRAARSLAPDVPEAELLDGLSDFDTYQDDAAQLAFADEQKVIRSGQPLVGKLEKQTYLSGTAHWSLTCKMPWRSPDGRIVGTFGISKDVTALKEAEEKIEQMHQQLMEASRQAGMAEVATGVLHNVGNVLNSVNVSATLVADHVRRTKAVNVVKLAALFEQHKANLADFITHDPRGQMIPSYLHTLADSIAGEQQALFAELENLRKNIEHIKDIVAMQQAYARTSGVMEAISVPDMVEDALRINAGSLARHDVDTVRDYQARPVVVTDKHKVMQILINLVRNAKYACDESGRNDKIITVKITRDDRAVKIAVVDNGVGIPSENLTRIFAHGFTTRKEGHGFGLHSGALAARELGGELSVHSDGPGCGAAFTLILPNKSEGNSHE
jgi:signal transduction histidine kinase